MKYNFSAPIASVVILMASASSAFSGACVDEGAGNRDNVQHYKNMSKAQAEQVINGGDISSVLGSMSSVDISNVIHRVNDYYIRKLGLSGRVLQKNATGELSDLQTIIGKSRGLSERQIEAFPSEFQDVVKTLSSNREIENFGTSLGVMTEQFIRNQLKVVGDDTEAKKTLQEWSNKNEQLTSTALEACDVTQTKGLTKEERSDGLKGLLDALRDGILDGDELRRDFEKSLKEGRNPKKPNPESGAPLLREIKYNFDSAPWSGSDGYSGQQRAGYSGPRAGTSPA